MLTDLDLQRDYRSGRDALLEDFYIPCLQESVSYDRAVGFFSSTLLHVVAVAYSDFVARDGHMRLICSPTLRPQDFEAMKAGADAAHLAQQSVRDELQALLDNPEAFPATRLLATLVAADVLQVHIAFTDRTPGIFHDKLGVFEDQGGRRVSFVGSANETWAAWGLNHESFEAFASWRGEGELLRTRNHADYFERLWQNKEPSIRVDPLDKVTRDQLLRDADDDLDHALDAARGRRRQVAATDRPLLPHQVAVLESWERHDRRGIVAFATGAGKTLTAIEAIRRWTATGRPALVLVPGSDLHRQWAGEIEQEMPSARLLLAGSGSDAAAWRRLLPVFTDAAAAGSSPRVILSTTATFASEAFLSRLRNDGQELLVIADEMHRAGSAGTIAALERVDCAGTLGLSATYRREWDEAGTDRLLAFFGEVLEPVVSLADAILMGRLVPYDYRLHTLELEDDELSRYNALTDRIRRVAVQAQGDDGLSEHLQMLLIQRARILKQARGKIPAALSILEDEYAAGERWLVYCDDTAQLTELVGQCLHRGLPVMEYHSAMSGDRDAVLNSLATHGGIVIAIRCLDEGVDIPTCDTALILASSTVEREYIQRRGRVLRATNDKVSATVHDLVLTDDAGGALTRAEATRALEFARLARNPGARAQLRLLLALSRDLEDLEATVIDSDEGVESE